MPAPLQAIESRIGLWLIAHPDEAKKCCSINDELPHNATYAARFSACILISQQLFPFADDLRNFDEEVYSRQEIHARARREHFCGDSHARLVQRIVRILSQEQE